MCVRPTAVAITRRESGRPQCPPGSPTRPPAPRARDVSRRLNVARGWHPRPRRCSLHRDARSLAAPAQHVHDELRGGDEVDVVKVRQNVDEEVEEMTHGDAQECHEDARAEGQASCAEQKRVLVGALVWVDPIQQETFRARRGGCLRLGRLTAGRTPLR